MQKFNLTQKIRKILGAISEKTALPTNQPTNQRNIEVLIWAGFREYLQIMIFFQKSGSFTFQPLYSPNLMQKIRKIFRVISEKTALPTNQPTHKILKCLILG